jgi:hypothetical protein
MDCDIGEEELFALAARSHAIGDGQWNVRASEAEDSGEDADEDGDDQSGSTVVQLSDGSWHVCRGMHCPHLEQSTDTDRLFTCKLSGMVVACAHESSHDSSWTGRSCSSADPDMQSSAVGGASWRFKRSAFAASAAAYSMARSMSAKGGSNSHDNVDSSFESMAPPTLLSVNGSVEEPAKSTKDGKRGAPCVVDVDDLAVQSHRRNKALRRIATLKERNVQSRLLTDASTVVVKLFSVVPTSSMATATASSSFCVSSSKRDRALAGGAGSLDDPRLENYDFVLNMALKRYAARCTERREMPTILGIHDVCVAANQFVKQRQCKAVERASSKSNASDRRIVSNGKTIELCSQLILNLWAAMCTTPYFVEHQSGDSFRPFAAGVMYALKRGLRLPNNMVLVPAVEPLAKHLPTLRSATATPAARQLQQASHRGLCAIQRAIASIDTMSNEEQQVALDQLRVVSSTATRLSNFVGGSTGG